MAHAQTAHKLYGLITAGVGVGKRVLFNATAPVVGRRRSERRELKTVSVRLLAGSSLLDIKRTLLMSFGLKS